MRLTVFLQNTDYVKELEDRLQKAERRASELEHKLEVAQSKMADVQLVNLELIDTLKAQGYKFRPKADSRTWGK